jgi:DNA polymerase-3 subunit alpha
MPENAPRFIHLRTHSEHSLLEGAIPVKKLADLAAQNGMPAVALTDTNALFAALEFSVKAQDAGVQPIIGCQITLEAGPGPAVTGPVVLLAQDRAGWLNLMELSTCLYLRDDGRCPMSRWMSWPPAPRG